MQSDVLISDIKSYHKAMRIRNISRNVLVVWPEYHLRWLPAWWALNGFPGDHQQNAAVFQFHVHACIHKVFCSCTFALCRQ